MEQIKSSKEILYNVKNIKSCFNIFNNAVKFSPKRKSDDIIEKQNFLSFLKNTNSNKETAVDSTNSKNMNVKQLPKKSAEIPKKKRIYIKFQDLLVESNKSEDSDSHLELALLIKKKKFPTHKKVRIFECHNINIDNNKDEDKNKNKDKDKDKDKDKEIVNDSKLKKSLSMNKVILGVQNKENKFIKTIKRKLFCC